MHVACMCSHAQTLPAYAHVYVMPARPVSRSRSLDNDENLDGYRAEDALITGCLGVHIVVRRLMSSDIDFNGHLR